MQRRTLTRSAKDVVYLRQLGQCAYCLRHLDDAFEVDHLNECCTDDRWANLAACCGSWCPGSSGTSKGTGARELLFSTAAARPPWACTAPWEERRPDTFT